MARQHTSGEPFAVLLADDIMITGHPLLSDMLKLYDRHQCSVLALMEVPHESISLYGCVAYDETDESSVVRITGITEKPEPDEAPSNFAVIGRYIFTPELFECLDQIKPGRNGEIQLTDAISLLLKKQPVLGYIIKGGRFDVGTKIDYLTAIVELALARDDLGPQFLVTLKEILERLDKTTTSPVSRSFFAKSVRALARRLHHKPNSK